MYLLLDLLTQFLPYFCVHVQLHHLLNNGAEVNQRDEKGFTPLHRAAYLAHYDGYLEIYEYLLSRGADPSLLTEDYDPYLNPGRKTAIEIASEEKDTRDKLKKLEKKYASVKKAREPHSLIGDWWTLYDHGLEEVKTWKIDYDPVFPEDAKRTREAAEKKAAKERRRKARAEAIASGGPLPVKKSVPQGPVAFLFPGQGSQAVGMLNETKDLPAVKKMLETANKVCILLATHTSENAYRR